MSRDLFGVCGAGISPDDMFKALKEGFTEKESLQKEFSVIAKNRSNRKSLLEAVIVVLDDYLAK